MIDFRTMAGATAVIAVLAGIAMMLAPSALLATYDVSLSPMGLVIYQFWGAALVGLGLVSWFARANDDMAVKRRFAVSLLVTTALFFVMALRGQAAGANAMGWSMVALFLLLALGFAWVSFSLTRKGK